MPAARGGFTELAAQVTAVALLAGAGVGVSYLMRDLASTSAPAPPVPHYDITTIPAELDRGCRRGRAKLYDERSDELGLVETATKSDAAEGRGPSVSAGTDCSTCD